MNLGYLVLIILIEFRRAFTSQDVYGFECSSPIKCVNSTAFAFCTVIDGEEQLIRHRLCLNDQKCSEANIFQPCVHEETAGTEKNKEGSSSTKPTSTINYITTTVGPPNCEEAGSGNYPAPKCNQYYSCSKTLWWWDSKLKTCPQNEAFDENLKKCVPSEQTACSLNV